MNRFHQEQGQGLIASQPPINQAGDTGSATSVYEEYEEPAVPRTHTVLMTVMSVSLLSLLISSTSFAVLYGARLLESDATVIPTAATPDLGQVNVEQTTTVAPTTTESTTATTTVALAECEEKSCQVEGDFELIGNFSEEVTNKKSDEYKDLSGKVQAWFAELCTEALKPKSCNATMIEFDERETGIRVRWQLVFSGTKVTDPKTVLMDSISTKDTSTILKDSNSTNVQVGTVEGGSIFDFFNEEIFQKYLKTGKTNCPTAQIRTFASIDYSFKGYNLLEGNPLMKFQIDPGWRQPIFTADYSEQHFTADCAYTVPRGLEIVHDISCERRGSGSVIRNENQLKTEHHLSIHVAASRGVLDAFGGGFALNGEFKEATQKLQKSESIYGFTRAQCRYYQTTLKESLGPVFHNYFTKLTDTLVEYLKNETIRESDKTMALDQYIKEFGTHYPRQITYGAKYYIITEVHKNFKEVSRVTSKHIEQLSNINFPGALAIDQKLDKSEKSDEVLTAMLEHSESHEVTIGSRPPADGAVGSWTSGIKQNPFPINVELLPLETVFTEGNFRNTKESQSHSKEAIAKLRRMVKKRIEELCLQNHISASATSCYDHGNELSDCVGLFFSAGSVLEANPGRSFALGDAPADDARTAACFHDRAFYSKIKRDSYQKLYSPNELYEYSPALPGAGQNRNTRKEKFGSSIHGLAVDRLRDFLFVSVKNDHIMGFYTTAIDKDKPFLKIEYLSKEDSPESLATAMVTQPFKKTLYFSQGYRLCRVYYDIPKDSPKVGQEWDPIVIRNTDYQIWITQTDEFITGMAINFQKGYLYILTISSAVWEMKLNDPQSMKIKFSPIKGPGFFREAYSLVYCDHDQTLYFMDAPKKTMMAYKNNVEPGNSGTTNNAEEILKIDNLEDKHYPTALCAWRYDRYDPETKRLEFYELPETTPRARAEVQTPNEAILNS